MAKKKDTTLEQAPEAIDPDSKEENADKANLDGGEIGSELSRAAAKVELDLDDAIFLDEEEEEESEDSSPPPDKAESSEKKEKAAKKLTGFSLWRSKKILFIAIPFLLGVAATLAWVMLKPEPGPPPPEQPAQEEAPPQRQEVAPPPPVELTGFTISLDPFWVEHETNGTYRFLSCQFAFPVKGDVLKHEINKKRIILRDAVYYYLRNKDLLFLRDKNNVEKLKKDLLEIINQYLGNGQIEEILIQDYRVE
ncbi:flagellar basal body-associated FliL family protein [Desulfoplanes sp.]